MISQIFVLGPRGDILIFRDFKSDVPKVRGEAGGGAGGRAAGSRSGGGALLRSITLRRRRAADPPCTSRQALRRSPRLHPRPPPLPPQASTEVFFRKARFWDGKGKNAPPAFQADGVQYLHIKVGRGPAVPTAPAVPAHQPRACRQYLRSRWGRPRAAAQCPKGGWRPCALPRERVHSALAPPLPRLIPQQNKGRAPRRRWAACSGWRRRGRMHRPPLCWSCCSASTPSRGWAGV